MPIFWPTTFVYPARARLVPTAWLLAAPLGMALDSWSCPSGLHLAGGQGAIDPHDVAEAVLFCFRLSANAVPEEIVIKARREPWVKPAGRRAGQDASKLAGRRIWAASLAASMPACPAMLAGSHARPPKHPWQAVKPGK